ncbi:polyamine ABC transporter substrate-binding protein [Amphritea sp. 1_MG-2023]|uniref:polyamine ABC transporter substrate-binding protein n=1 Tax=Amphritea sp. 1_MG-2023 TaxID=3062670 RepID=UPI0026E1F96C|nr:polyamine ABC transporter substrate-binding protein [Amphritea sp. 1_MG-2023]MDO6563399.1 polyamine ABC transporter substrate-binding protein [Amphritea sp. 1_MG-2023]
MKHKTSTTVKSVLLSTALFSSSLMAASDENTLHIYNWSDYIAEDTIAKFEQKTGIKVVYDTFDSYESVEAKLLAGKSGYDLVMFDSSLSPRLIKAEIFKQLDKSKLPGWSNLDTAVLSKLESYDPGLKYTLPYTWGTVGFTYNVDMINERMADAPVDSLDMLFKPEVISKFADCGVTVVDVSSDMVPAALSYLGLDPNSNKKSDIKAVEELFSNIRPYIKKFDSTGYLSALPNRENCLSVTWSGDYAVASMRAAEAGSNVNLKYTIPKEGVPIWFDSLYIPSDSENVDAAHQFMAFLLQPEIIADVTNYIGYANANQKSTELIDASISSDPGIYPDEDTLNQLISKAPKDSKSVRQITKAWSRIKTGR